MYLIQTKAMSKRYAPVITGSAGGRGPGREKAPFPQIKLMREETGRKHGEAFPEGLYVAVSRIEDLYILQSSRPQMVMLAMSAKNVKILLAEDKPGDQSAPLPFKPSEIILALDPWFPQETAEYENGKMSDQIEKLVEKGYLQYEINNPGHFSLFKNHKKAKLIAGPWLYMFNSWALSFIASAGADGFVSPLENNRQNLERTLGVKSRGGENRDKRKRQKTSILHSRFFITVFAWPPLFNIRADLGSVLKLGLFADNRDEVFSLVAGDGGGGSRVYPKEPFSIIDKIKFLKEAGFGRFIIDLTGNHLKKSDYKDLMRSVKENAPLPHSSRFNWKDGFYSDQNTGSNSLFANSKTASSVSSSE